MQQRCFRWYAVGLLLVLPALLMAQQNSEAQGAKKDSAKQQSVVILPSQITVPDTLQPLMSAWLAEIFGSNVRSPFVTVVLQPGLCSRCEAYLPHLLDITLHVDSALKNNIALVVHSLSPGTVDMLKEEYPYRDYSIVHYDSTGIIEKIVPSGMPYYIIWDAAGKPLYSALLFGRVDIEELQTVLQQALRNRQPLNLTAEMRLPKKVNSAAQCTLGFQSDGVYRWSAQKEYVLSNSFFSLGRSSITGIFPQLHLFAFETDILRSYVLYSLDNDSLFCILQIPEEAILQHISIDSLSVIRMKRLGLLRPILTGGLQIAPSATVQELYLPQIFYEQKESGDSVIGASTIQNIAFLTVDPLKQCLAIDTLFPVPFEEEYIGVLSDVYQTPLPDLTRTKLLYRLTKGVPFTSYAYRKGSILRDRFYDSAFAFALYDINAQRFTILPIRLPDVYRRLKIGYGPLLPHSGCFLDSNRYAAVYPLSPYLWIYGPHTIDTIPLRSYATLKQQVQKIARVLRSAHQAIRDTNAFFENYSEIVDTTKSLLQLVLMDIDQINDSLIAVYYRVQLPQRRAYRSGGIMPSILCELYNIHTKQYLTSFSAGTTHPGKQCGILWFYHIPGTPWNTHWYLVSWEGNRMRVTEFHIDRQ